MKNWDLGKYEEIENALEFFNRKFNKQLIKFSQKSIKERNRYKVGAK